MEMVYDCLSDKRSAFGSNAVKIVDKHFKLTKFKNNPAAVRAYVHWALNKHGPAFWGTPIPQKEEDRVGKVPKGLFESSFIIETAAPLLKFTANAAGAYGEPVGALALVAAAVERAFKMYLSGTKVVNFQDVFSEEKIGSFVLDHLKDARKISANAWPRIKAACGQVKGSNDRKQPPAPILVSLEQDRGNRFIASSPPPGAID
ncbi:hypothetical protein CPB83DRAFT_899946 [Crepidotus variabilis]|uniref:DUF6532 domain-containing protein n=1 Tax=Crepidotus variabilis TaxID=179855 RepID=A0A9P6E3X2_9AGAR|nr:hypothetical protein CPB83DRAFT_899946 [Crepidotus variabilis]